MQVKQRKTAMKKRLSDINPNSQNYQNAQARVVPIVLGANEASKRLILHSAKRVIATHKTELEKLAYK